jgi:hypothetical protein
LLFAFCVLSVGSIAQVQPPVGGVAIDAGNCKVLISDRAARQLDERKLRTLWTGGCVNGMAHGFGVLRVYSFEKLQSISKRNYENGAPSVIESYGLLSNNLIFAARTLSDGKFSTVEISYAEVPEWAGEIVDGKPRLEQVMLQNSTPKQANADVSDRDRVENKPGQPIKAGGNPPPGKGVPAPVTQPGSGSSAGTTTTGATSAGNNNDMNSGTRRDGSMTYSTGVYFFRATFQGRFMGFEAAQAGSESEALGILRSGSSYQFNYDGGCPAGSKVAGPYWGKANFRSVSGGGIGHAWACGFISEVEAGNAVIDYCKRTSCATSDQYMTLAIGNVQKQPQPLDQYLCADGNPGTQAGNLGPRTGRGARSRRDPSANNSIQQFQGEDEPCISFVKRWMR